MILKERKLLKSLWTFQTDCRKKQFWLLLVLTILSAMLEVVSLGAVLPFLGILIDPEKMYSMQEVQPLIQFANITNPIELILPVTIIFIVVVLIAAAVRLILLYAIIKFSFAVGADLSIGIYRRTLYQNYSVHVSRNSSEVINGIITKTSTVIHGVVSPILTLMASVVLIFGITTALFFINTEVALSAFFGFGFLYLSIILYTKKRLKKNGECIAEESTRVIKSLQEGLGGIRDVIIDSNQEFYCRLYRESDLPLRQASGDNQFISSSPRYLMEAVGMSLIAILAYFMTQDNKGFEVIPILGALALGAQRLLPALQQAYSSYSTFIGSIPSFKDAMKLLMQPLPKVNDNQNIDHIKFDKSLHLKNIEFRHSDSLPYVLKGIDIKIKKGSCVGFIGVTGSGKSTLLDIVMRLLTPTSGKLLVDSLIINKDNEKFWQEHISHVPQTVYLSDATIEENIAFGISKKLIDHDRVRSAAKKAQISNLIDGWKNGYETTVGERGIKLSGGQRQRIGIARALYKQSTVLIFDEATSALDSQTEKKIMNTINSLDNELTILIIAHRVTTLKDCDQIIDLSDHGNAVVKKYDDIINDI
jgi:ATP-binding cassette, subfamily B, bacterial PglK